MSQKLTFYRQGTRTDIFRDNICHICDRSYEKLSL